MKSKKKCVYELNGDKGILNIALAHGISPNTVKSRLYSGCSIEEAVLPGSRRTHNKGEPIYEWGGVWGIKNIADLINTTEATIYSHLRRTKNIDSAVRSILSGRNTRAVAKAAKQRATKASDTSEIKKTTSSAQPSIDSAWRIALGLGGATETNRV